MSFSPVHLWPGDIIRLPSGSRGRVVRWRILANDDLGKDKQERVAELELESGAKLEASEALMRQATKVG